eukprot:EG_transcript_26412
MPLTPAVPAKPWSQWENYRKLKKLVATGSYRPPEWYYAMRVSPPPPRSYKDPTRVVQAKRSPIAKQLMKEHPHLHTLGSSIFNNFWMEKPVERLVRQYEVLRSEGLSAQEAYAKVSDECARTVNVIRRQQSIMAHQAKVDGTSMTIREAQGMLRVAGWVQRSTQASRQTDYAGMHEAIRTKVVRDMNHLYVQNPGVWNIVDQGAATEAPPEAVPAATKASAAV